MAGPYKLDTDGSGRVFCTDGAGKRVPEHHCVGLVAGADGPRVGINPACGLGDGFRAGVVDRLKQPGAQMKMGPAHWVPRPAAPRAPRAKRADAPAPAPEKKP